MIYGSVCSGIEAASVAWHPLGWRPAFFSEIDAFPRAVLAHHYPDTPLHGDFTTIQAGQYAAIDVLVGGTPCQSFSVAGLRGGLGDDRGNLALEYLRLADRLRPRWLVWENVPGVLSSNGGRDFGSILGGLGELGYGWAYRVLDAQYVRVDGFARAVPQRRRRVFVVGCLGDWRRAAAVLFERESLCGHPAPRRETGKGAAPTLAARTKGDGGLGTDFDCDGGLVAGAYGLRSDASRDGTAKTPSADAEGRVRLRDPGFNVYAEHSPTLDSGAAHIVAHTLNAKGGAGRSDSDSESETFLPVAHAIQAGAFRENPDSGPDGIGVQSGIAYTLEARAEVQAVCFDETQITSAENRCNPQPGDPCHPLAKGARPPALAFKARQDPDVFHGHTGPMDTDGSTQAILTGWRVRRLMPVECERLQGFPDGYTAIPYRGKPAADGPRYKALGNSMAVNVMRWIGQRIDLVERCARVPAEGLAA